MKTRVMEEKKKNIQV